MKKGFQENVPRLIGESIFVGESEKPRAVERGVVGDSFSGVIKVVDNSIKSPDRMVTLVRGERRRGVKI